MSSAICNPTQEIVTFKILSPFFRNPSGRIASFEVLRPKAALLRPFSRPSEVLEWLQRQRAQQPIRWKLPGRTGKEFYSSLHGSTKNGNWRFHLIFRSTLPSGSSQTKPSTLRWWRPTWKTLPWRLWRTFTSSVQPTVFSTWTRPVRIAGTRSLFTLRILWLLSCSRTPSLRR